MVRKLAYGAALTAAVLPSWAFALGLGDIDLHSHINQPLQAEIPLVSAQQEDLGSVRVSLASQADFARAGIDWQSGLRHLRFTVEEQDGRPVIRVTTNDDFREPFLSFLMEVNWSRGRLLREYTVLVDPPVFTDRRSAGASTPAVQQPAQPAATPVPARRSVAATPQGLPGSTQTPTEYGPTQRQDTLWTIAQNVRPDESVTVEQTMLALQRLNPDAFIENNVNRLKAGHVLKVPDLSEIDGMNAADARTEFRRQTRVWRAGTTPEAAAEPVAESQSAPEGRLRLLAPEGTGSASGEQAAAGGADEGTAAGAGGDDVAAAEASAALSQENTELRERVSELQAQLDQLQAVAQLKDDQLAALEQQLRALGAQEQAPSDAAGEPAPAVEPVASETTPEETTVQYSAVVEATPAQGQPANPYVVEGFQPVDLTALPQGGAAEPFKEFEQTDAAPSEGPEAVAAAEDGEVVEPSQSSEAQAGLLERARAVLDSTLATARSNPLYAAGAAAILVLIVLALLLARQRRRTAAGFGESILQETRKGEDGSLAVAAGAAASANGVDSEERSNESSYLSDFGVSGMDSNIESEISEADPLTEADVFLAYGRFQPAENMIKEAIDSEPERLDLKAKLLEIYHAAKNRDAFEREAQLFHTAVEDHSDSSWQKVAQMGRELCPDNPLFREDVPAAPAREPEDVAVDPVTATDAEGSDDELAEFTPREPVAAEANDTAPAEPEDNSIDFDLGDLGDLTAGVASEEPAAESKGGLDFDIDLEAGSGDTPGGSADQDFAADLADELSALTESFSAQGEGHVPQPQSADDVAEFDFDDLGVDLDEIAQHPAAAGTEESAADDGEEPLLASAEDEVSTKLDLARAYIDMGDPDGAKNILDEVLEEGSEGQKHEAEELMQQIS